MGETLALRAPESWWHPVASISPQIVTSHLLFAHPQGSASPILSSVLSVHSPTWSFLGNLMSPHMSIWRANRGFLGGSRGGSSPTPW